MEPFKKNIVEETLKVLKDHGKAPEDVSWVGSNDGEYAMSWEDFFYRFTKIVYDAGYGAQEIAQDLVVVGDNWWLEREEYDGAENWIYKNCPTPASKPRAFSHITHPEGDGWCLLSECNWDEEAHGDSE